MNDFEKYLKEHKNQFDPQKVDGKVWLGIENDLLKQNNKRIKYLFSALAIGAIILLGLYIFHNTDYPNASYNEEHILEQYDLTKHNFTQQVSYKKEQLTKVTIPKDKLEDVEILLQQLEFMDGQFQDYLDYIKQNGYQEFIGDQISNFYKSKIDLLDKIRSEIEKINYYENIQPSNMDKVSIEI